MARKIVQISSADWGGAFGKKRGMMVFALADDGNVYSLEVDNLGMAANGWTALPVLPDRLSGNSEITR